MFFFLCSLIMIAPLNIRIHIHPHIQKPSNTVKKLLCSCLSKKLRINKSPEQGSKEQDASGQQRVEEKVFSDDELVSLIDPILQMDDISRDGYIDYPEFIKAQQKAAANQQQQEEQHHEDWFLTEGNGKF